MNTFPQSRGGAQSARAARSPLSRTAISVVVAAMTAALLVVVPRLADAASDYDNVDQRLVETFVDAGVSISQGAYDAETTDAVVLATDANFPDALTASAVAAAVGGPVLFTPPDQLSQATAAEIDRLLEGSGTVYVMGGTEAIQESVVEELAPYEVQRISGPTRLETAVAAAGVVGIPADGTVIIARAFGPQGANTPSDRTTGWVDAISCGAYAAANQIPILLTQTPALSDATAAALQGAGGAITNAIICGGTTAVGLQVEQDLQGLGITSRRISGPTRVETAVAAATDLFGFATAGGHQFTVVNGYGENFGFGLAAAPLGHPILLVGTNEPTDCQDESQPSRATLCYLQTGTDSTPANILLVGSEVIIRDVVANAVGAAAGGSPVPTESGTATPTPTPGDLGVPSDVEAVDDINDDGTRLTVTWDAIADDDDLLGYNVYVDGRRQGPADPTVNASTTTFVVTGLTPDQEVEVTVTAVTTEEEESEESEADTATPQDEKPTKVTGFEADPGNSEVVLEWDAGPVDTAQYVIERGQPASGACPGSGYTTIATVRERDTTTTTDTTAENDVTYCYRITITDTGGQTSDPTHSLPVAPGTGPPQVTIDNLEGDSQAPGFDGDTLYFGQDFLVLFTANDPDTAFADLRQTWEISNDGGQTYSRVGQANTPLTPRAGGSGNQAQFVLPTCTTVAPLSGNGDTTSTGCIRDEAQQDVRVRVTVTDGQPSGTDREGTTDLQVVRRPGPVQNVTATPGPGSVTLGWDRLANITVTDYIVFRQEITTAPDSEDGAGQCADPSTTPGAYSRVGNPVPQPPRGTDITGVSGGEVENGESVGETQISDNVYCYFVQARRTEAVEGARSAVSAANPAADITGAVTLGEPAQGDVIVTGRRQDLGYTINTEGQVTASSVVLQYCLDWRQALGQTQAQCQDEGGFKTVQAEDLPQGLPRAEGPNSAVWDVDANISQPDSASQGGAVQVVVTFSDGSEDRGRNTGIFFT